MKKNNWNNHQRILRHIIIFLFLISFVFCFNANKTYAQQDDQSRQLQTQLDNLQTSYKKNFELYYQDNRQYLIAKEEYHHHQTLASVENFVKDTKKIVHSRNQVLITFMEMMQLRLKMTKTLPLEDKVELLSDLEETVQKVKQFNIKLNDIYDVENLNNYLSDFPDIFYQMQQNSYQAILFVKYDGIKRVANEISNLFNELEETTPRLSNQVKEDERLRSFDLTQKAIADNNLLIKKLWEQIKYEEDPEKIPDYKGLKQGSFEQFNEIYGNFRQIMFYIKELNNNYH